jgi:DNA repair exonuclease SbcCD nuclease subunit
MWMTIKTLIMMKTFEQNKISIISDLHFGVHQGNATWHNISFEFAKWFKKQLIKQKIKDIVICGDVNNDRNEISVNTMHVVTNIFKLWKQFNIKIIIGNHDAYYKDRCDVNSLGQFAEWPNIDLIDKLTTIEQYGQKISFCPWSTQLSDIPKGDITFGHFDIAGFKVNKTKISAEGLKSYDIMNRSPLIISGHFHIRDERKYENGIILYTGSAYQLNWGDCNEERGFYIFNIEDKSYSFIENDYSPKHIKFRLSELLAIGKITDEMKKEFKGNFINFIIDKSINTDQLDILITKLNSLNPLSLKTEFENDQKYIDENFNFESTAVDVIETIQEFINMLDLKNKEEVKKYTIELYKRIT